VAFQHPATGKAESRPRNEDNVSTRLWHFAWLVASLSRIGLTFVHRVYRPKLPKHGPTKCPTRDNRAYRA